MKRSSSYLIIALLCAVLFSSCDALRKMQTTDNDDVYLDPKKDRAAFYKPEEVPVTATAKAAEPVANADDANNPYYKDPDYDPDDYYDNQYASRIRRFHNPTYGLGYYDSYYTNSYYYNANPYMYGTSIYSSYNFWGPYPTSYIYMSNIGNWGGGYTAGIGYGNYCSMNGYGWGWGYQNPWYNPYYGYNYGYNPYGFNSWNNPYYGGGYGYNPYGGYYNSYDYNSSTYYGPRTTHSGSNSRMVINPGTGLEQRMAAPNTGINEPKTAVAPTDIKRFDHTIMSPKTNMSKDPVVTGSGIIDNTPRVINNDNNNGSNPKPKYGFPVKGDNGGVKGKDEDIKPNDNATSQPKPKKNWFDLNSDNSNSGSSNTGGGKKSGWGDTKPSFNSGGGSTPSFNKSGGSSGGGGGGGVKSSGGLRPR